ncbi:MAG: HAD-IIA family hydrolase [Halobacterium sp.]
MTFRGAILDLDGTVVRGDELVPGARDAVAALRARVDRVLFLTNNPTEPPAAYAERLGEFGVDADPVDVVTSGTATIAYLDEHHAGDAVYPIAEERVVSQLRDAEIELTEDPEEADVVVAGYHRDFHYTDLQAAIDALDDDTALVGTDPDVTVPAEHGEKPGSGAIVNAVAGVAEREPDAVLGKPSETTARLAAERVGVPPEECVLVGDRLDTDVAMGERVGMTTVLVRTGVATDADVAASTVRPDHVVDSLSDVPGVLD